MKSPNSLFLVRHGQTVWNTEGRLQGHQDSALTSIGKQQAEAMGTKLIKLLPEDFRIVSSPLGRCRETSEIIAATLQYPLSAIEYDSRLKEISFGNWEGQKTSDVRIRDSVAYSFRLKNRWDVPAPGGENYAMVADRLHAWIADTSGVESLVVVSHGCTGRILRGVIEGLPRDAIYTLDESHGAIYLLKDNTVTRVD